jgi:site-specific recombinase XerD
MQTHRKLTFYRLKWKRSTASTTESRIRHHLLPAFGEQKLSALGLKMLQAFLSSKATTFSKSIVAHLRWDLRAIFKLAVTEGYIERDPTGSLYTPKEAKVAATRSTNRKEAEQHINALDLRERVIDHLACLSGCVRARSWHFSGSMSLRIAARW